MAQFAVRWVEALIDADGVSIKNAPFQILKEDGSPATVYANRNKALLVGTPQTDSFGNAEAWLEPGNYRVKVGSNPAIPLTTLPEDDADTISPSDLTGGLLQGPQGAPGPVGIGIAGMSISGSGHLLVTLTNGTQVDAGLALGPKGDPGPIAPSNINIIGPWDDSRSYLAFDAVTYGTTLWVALQDNTGQEPPVGNPAGNEFWFGLSIVGTKGEDGEDGQDGRGVTSATVDPVTHEFLLTYTDGTTVNLGNVQGPPGQDGANLGIVTNATQLRAWTEGDAYERLTQTFGNTSFPTLPTTAGVRWPDKAPGTFTAIQVNTSFGTVDAYEVTYEKVMNAPVLVKQFPVIRNSNGSITTKPALRVSSPSPYLYDIADTALSDLAATALVDLIYPEWEG